MTTEKLHKVLAAAGLGSRRQIEKWIAEGRVGVDGEVAHVGHRVGQDVAITLDGKPVALREAPVTRVIIYHKPLGEICTRSDPQGRPTVFDRLPGVSGRWISVGRLDINTTGLLVLTNDGLLASRLMHPSTRLEREYMVRVHGNPTSGQLDRLTTGIDLDGRPARFNALESLGKKADAKNQRYRIKLSEGRNREIRRLWEKIGCRVNQLKRVRFGPVHLPANLPPGSWLELDADTVLSLQRGAGTA